MIPTGQEKNIVFHQKGTTNLGKYFHFPLGGQSSGHNNDGGDIPSFIGDINSSLFSFALRRRKGHGTNETNDSKFSIENFLLGKLIQSLPAAGCRLRRRWLLERFQSVYKKKKKSYPPREMGESCFQQRSQQNSRVSITLLTLQSAEDDCCCRFIFPTSSYHHHHPTQVVVGRTELRRDCFR